MVYNVGIGYPIDARTAIIYCPASAKGITTTLLQSGWVQDGNRYKYTITFDQIKCSANSQATHTYADGASADIAHVCKLRGGIYDYTAQQAIGTFYADTVPTGDINIKAYFVKAID